MGPPERIESAPQGSFAPATTPSRDRLLYAYDRSDFDIYRFRSAQPAEPVMASSSVDYGPRISPDGRRIAFESWRSGSVKEIWLADVDGQNPVQLTHVAADPGQPARGTGAPFWSPDGQHIVHARVEERGSTAVSNLWVIGVDGSSDRRLTNGSLWLGPPVWSRDGRFIYYREDRPDGRDYVRIPATGGAPERITHRGALLAEESWDGKWLLHSTSEGRGPLFLLSLDGGKDRQIEDCALSRALASSPGAFYYIGCPSGLEDPLYRYDPASGRRERLGTIEKGSGAVMGLAVSRDTQTILHGRDMPAGSDLMMVENFR